MFDSHNIGFRMAGILAVCLGAAPVHAANALTPAEKKAGWILLFDGVDKDAHWRHGETGNTPSKWTVEDSAMRTFDQYTFLCTKATDQFSDFEWQIDWKLAKKGNSGLFIRVVSSTYDDGYEYAILDDENGGDRTEVSKNPADRLPSGKMAYIKRTGAIYDLYPTTRNGAIGGEFYDSTASKPFGQWNHGVIWAEGDYIEHWLNGRKVADVEIGTPEWNARFANSKWNVPSVPDREHWARHPTGSLCLQAHGGGDEGLAWFRNIKVRPFTPGETLVSPLVSPAGGGFTASVKVGLEVAITDAAIHYTLDGSEPTESSPAYRDSITLTATTTLKAKTFRARFKSSPATVAVFSKGPSALGKRDLSPAPEVSLSPDPGGGFIIRNGNASRFEGAVYGLSGTRLAEFRMTETEPVRTLRGLAHGVYLVRLQRGGWMQLRKIATP